MRTLFTAVLLLLISIESIQAFPGDSPYTLKEKTTISNAKRAYNSGDYESSLRLYRTIHKTHEKDININYRMGQCHLSLGMTSDALYYFERVAELSGEVDKQYYYDYGTIYQLTGDYDNALKNYQIFKGKCESEKEINASQIDNYINECKYALNGLKTPLKVRITALSDSINSEYTDAAPSITADGKTMVYTSRRPENKGGDLANDGAYFEDIYMSTWNERSNSWGKGSPIQGSINSKEHDAATSISPDGSYIYVYMNVEKVTQSGDVLYSKKGSTGRWTKPKPLIGVNSSWFETSACVTPDGKRMYFISERVSGGNGLGDIWTSVRIGKNEWGKPTNLGLNVNTSEDEVGVFMHPDGKTIFFASKGHFEQNYGGYDIFKTILQEDGTFSKAQNVGNPINTYRDERHFVLSTDGKTGYFTAQRNDERKDLDIYSIDLSQYNIMTGETVEKPKLTIIKGVINDAQTGRSVEAEVEIKMIETGEVFNVTSDVNGEYFNTLTANKEYEVTINKDGYKPFNQKFLLPAGEWDETFTFENVIDLSREGEIEIVDKKLFQVQTIRFQSSKSKAEFSDEVKVELDLFASQLEKVSSLKVKLVGHTDSSGNEDSNKKLSLERANMVAKYFKDKGIASDRILTEGYGSGNPIADNSSDEGKAKNRRVEIRIFE